MEQIFRLHDAEFSDCQGGNFLQVGVLGYADDAALLDDNCEVATKRVTAISQGSKNDADMHINVAKTLNRLNRDCKFRIVILHQQTIVIIYLLYRSYVAKTFALILL